LRMSRTSVKHVMRAARPGLLNAIQGLSIGADSVRTYIRCVRKIQKQLAMFGEFPVRDPMHAYLRGLPRDCVGGVDSCNQQLSHLAPEADPPTCKQIENALTIKEGSLQHTPVNVHTSPSLAVLAQKQFNIHFIPGIEVHAHVIHKQSRTATCMKQWKQIISGHPVSTTRMQ
jgi:hypothetical protein